MVLLVIEYEVLTCSMVNNHRFAVPATPSPVLKAFWPGLWSSARLTLARTL
jgi:hypothetical protein